MNITKILATKQLPNSTTPKLDIELLLTATLNCPRSFLYSHPEYQLTAEQEKNFEKLFQRRTQDEPIAYILGKKEFWSLELTVNNYVLIPRPETEILVEATLARLTTKTAVVADLGTGSGAIAIALAHERPNWNIIATDISKEALQLAQSNAASLQLNNITFYQGTWCLALPEQKFDAIISNPPYIAKNDVHLQKGEIRFEPRLALEANDGFGALEQIIMQAPKKLKKGGLLILEHGYNQSKELYALLQQNNYQEITTHKDLAGIDRMTIAKTL